MLIGSNGSGKSSLLDALNVWYKLNCFSSGSDESYIKKDKNSSFTLHQDVIVEFHGVDKNEAKDRKSMYFRTAYRNDPDFTINSLGRVGSPFDNIRVDKMINNDQTVSQNYQRLISDVMAGVFAPHNNSKTVLTLREELIGKIRSSMQNVFDDLLLNNIGDPMSDGSFHFAKGKATSFHYRNLSGGEKSAFDLLLDLILKVKYYNDSVYLIDEPETHMHTGLQGKLVEEMVKVIPSNSQLWLSTHSLGVMRSAQKIEKEYPGSVAIIDFSDFNFDEQSVVEPSKLGKVVWEKFLSIALDDFAGLIAPETIILCEGSPAGRGRRDFDASIYNKIFASKYPNVTFVSAGNSSELEDDKHIGFNMLKNILQNSSVFRLVDRDEKSDEQVKEFIASGIKVLSERHLESYLFADEILERFTSSKDGSKLSEILAIKQTSINNSVSRGNPHNDIKSASGEIYNGIRRILQVNGLGSSADIFMRDVLAGFVTEDTATYKKLEDCIFSN